MADKPPPYDDGTPATDRYAARTQMGKRRSYAPALWVVLAIVVAALLIWWLA